jgi:hypothetical protein
MLSDEQQEQIIEYIQDNPGETTIADIRDLLGRSDQDCQATRKDLEEMWEEDRLTLGVASGDELGTEDDCRIPVLLPEDEEAE